MSAVGRSLQQALNFLLDARNPVGWWQDFQLAPGFSDEWVTAHVGATLALSPEGSAMEAARHAWDILASRNRPSAAWGYNALPPGDADSTAWGIMLAEAVGNADSPRAARARDALLLHHRNDGGIATYAEDGPIRRFINAPPDRSFAGWCASQPCVTAAVARLPDMLPLVQAYIQGTQRPGGGWFAYWWCDHEYATALAAESLFAGGQEHDQRRVQWAVHWARRRLTQGDRAGNSDFPDGSPFATAWCLRVLLLDPQAWEDGTVARLTAWLVGAQLSDGSWPSSARLRVPLPEDTNPDAFTGWVYGGRIEGAVVLDQRRVFTTVTVLAALQAVQMREASLSDHVKGVTA